MRRPEIVKRVQETVRQTEPSATIILYGSEARGDARITDVSDTRNIRKKVYLSEVLCS